MPRKALATARAALRFAHRAADDCGLDRPHSRVLNQRERHGVLLGNLPVVGRTNAYQKLGAEVDSATSLGVFYNL